VLGVFLDTETNGLNARKHRVLELAYTLLDMETGAHRGEFQSIVYQSHELWQQSDPESLRVNGFTWEEISQGKKSDEIQKAVVAHFEQEGIRRGKAVFICQNPSFDRAFLSQLIDPDLQEKLGWPYHWLDLASMYWVESLRIGRKEPSRLPWNTGFSKDRIAAAYHLPPEEKPHRAMNGVHHLILCYRAVVGFR
jgi:oligoribonuclease